MKTKERGLYFRFIFSYTVRMFNLPENRLCEYTVRCKGCIENIPVPVQTMPYTWIIAGCLLCGARRRYLPADIFRGSMSPKLAARPRSSEVRRWGR